MSIAACLVLAFWTLLALDRKRWWPGELTLRRGPGGAPEGAGPAPEARGSILVVVPARNEAHVLRETLPALLSQSASMERLVLVNDCSTDGTGEVALELAREAPEPHRVSIVAGEAPPAGWVGKTYALKTGLEKAGGSSEWVLLTDADILHPPDSVAALASMAQSQKRDLVSVMVRLRADTFWERLLVPPFVWFFQLLYPFRRVADDRSRVAAAAGGCLLIRRSTLEGIGGLETIRREVIDDVGLARRVKAAGGRLWLGLDEDMLSLRGYSSLGEITRMVARTAFDQLQYRYVLVLGALVFLGLFFAAPPLFAVAGMVSGDALTAAAGCAAWLIQAALFFPAVRHHRVPWAYALTLPAASLLYAYMTAVSAWRHLRGKGVQWHGRVIGREEREGGERVS